MMSPALRVGRRKTARDDYSDFERYDRYEAGKRRRSWGRKAALLALVAGGALYSARKYQTGLNNLRRNPADSHRFNFRRSVLHNKTYRDKKTYDRHRSGR